MGTQPLRFEDEARMKSCGQGLWRQAVLVLVVLVVLLVVLVVLVLVLVFVRVLVNLFLPFLLFLLLVLLFSLLLLLLVLLGLFFLSTVSSNSCLLSLHQDSHPEPDLTLKMMLKCCQVQHDAPPPPGLVG